MIAKELDKPKDVSSLLQTNHRFAFLLTPVLREFALQIRYYGEAALFWAAASGHEPMVRLLLERGFEMEVKAANRKLLHRAPGKCDDATVKRVLEEGANLVLEESTNPPIKDNCWELSALQWAAFHGHEALVALLLSKGADTSVQNSHGRTALCLAVQRKNKLIIDLLLEKVDVTFADKLGRTPLHVAAEHCDKTAVESLLGRGADINSADIDQSCTPLLTAVRRGDEALGLVELLLERGADIEAKDNLERRALHLAAAKMGTRTVGLLLGWGADVNAQDTYRRTPLHVAVQYKCPAIGLLLEKGAAIDVQDIFGRTALLLAAQRGSSLAVRMLLEKGADVTIPDYCGRMVPDWVLE